MHKGNAAARLPRPENGIQAIVQTILGPEFEKTTGKFLYQGKEIELPAAARDRTAQQRLWQISEDLTALTIGDVMPVNNLQP